MANFKFVYDNTDNSLAVHKGKKFVKIRYNAGMDLYDVDVCKIKKDFSIEKQTMTGVYADMLKGIIQEHFPTFEYVMRGLRIYDARTGKRIGEDD